MLLKVWNYVRACQSHCTAAWTYFNICRLSLDSFKKSTQTVSFGLYVLEPKLAEIHDKFWDVILIVAKNVQLLSTFSKESEIQFHQSKMLFSKWNELWHILHTVSLSSCSRKICDQAFGGACLVAVKQRLLRWCQMKWREGWISQGLSSLDKRPVTFAHQAWREGSG